MTQDRVMKIGFGLMFVLFIWMVIAGVREHNATISIVSFIGLFGTGISYGIWRVFQLLILVGIEAVETKHRVQGLAWYAAMRDDHPEELAIYKERYGSVVCGCPNCRSKQQEIENIVTVKHIATQEWGEDAGEDSV